jgi:ABC-2 type transport system permease protein
MIALVKMEGFRLLRQSRTYYALAGVMLIEAAVLLSAYYQGNQIIDILLSQLRESFYFEGTLVNGNLITYLILNSMWFHLPLILMIVVSGLLTSEYKDRTLLTAMMQPVSKVRYLSSKYLVGILFSVIIVLLLLVTSLGFSYVIFGRGDLVVLLDGLNFYEQPDAFLRIVLAFAAGTFSMVFYSVTSLTLAVIFKDITKTWIVSVLFIVISNLLMKIDFGSQFLNNVFYFKLNQSWQFFFYPDIPWSQIILKTSLIVLYTTLMALLGIFLFKTKDID